MQSTTQYDSLNRAATIVYPTALGPGLCGAFITVYDADGRKAKTIDQAGKVTNFDYDGQGRLILL